MAKSELSLSEYVGYFKTIQEKLTILKGKVEGVSNLGTQVQSLMDKNPFKNYTAGDFPISNLSASSCVILSIKDTELGGNTYFGMSTSDYNAISAKLSRVNNNSNRNIFVIPSSNTCKCFYGCFKSEETPIAGTDLLFNPEIWNTARFMQVGSGTSTWTTSSSSYNNYRNNYVYFKLNDSDDYKVCGKQNFANNSAVTSGTTSDTFKLNATSGACAIIPSNKNVGDVSSIKDTNTNGHCLQDELLFSADGINIIGEIANFGAGSLLLTLTPEIQDINFLKSCADKMPIGIDNMSILFNGLTFEFEASETINRVITEDEGYCSCGCPEAEGSPLCVPITIPIVYSSGGKYIGSFYCPNLSKCNAIFDPSADYEGGNIVFNAYKCNEVGSCPLGYPPKRSSPYFWARANMLGFPLHVSLKILKEGLLANMCVGCLEIIVNAINACLDLQISSNISYINYENDFPKHMICDAFRSQISNFSDMYANFTSVGGGGDLGTQIRTDGIYIVEYCLGSSEKDSDGNNPGYTATRALKLLEPITEGSCSFYTTPATLSFYMKVLK